MTTINKNDFITNEITTNGVDLKQAEANWKAYREENGTAGSTGVAAEFYAELREGVMDDSEFTAWIEAQSNNVQKHKSHYNQIRQLANDVHNIYE